MKNDILSKKLYTTSGYLTDLGIEKLLNKGWYIDNIWGIIDNEFYWCWTFRKLGYLVN